MTPSSSVLHYLLVCSTNSEVSSWLENPPSFLPDSLFPFSLSTQANELFIFSLSPSFSVYFCGTLMSISILYAVILFENRDTTLLVLPRLVYNCGLLTWVWGREFLPLLKGKDFFFFSTVCFLAAAVVECNGFSSQEFLVRSPWSCAF